MLSMSANGLPTQLEINMTEAATKQPGKIQQLFGLWEKAGDGELLPRAFAIELAVAEGINPSTARTQYQVWFKREQLAELVGETAQ